MPQIKLLWDYTNDMTINTDGVFRNIVTGAPPLLPFRPFPFLPLPSPPFWGSHPTSNAAMGSGGAFKLPQRVRAARRFVVHFWLKSEKNASCDHNSGRGIASINCGIVIANDFLIGSVKALVDPEFKPFVQEQSPLCGSGSEDPTSSKVWLQID